MTNPVLNDGFITLSSKENEAMTMSETTKALLEQRALEVTGRMTHSGQRLSDANDNVSEQTKLGYLTEQRVVGVREAKASSMLQPVYGQPVPIQQGVPGAAA